jgi:hypothetical protein
MSFLQVRTKGLRLKDIESELRALLADVQRVGTRSIAVPPPNCGNGGLGWESVSRTLGGDGQAVFGSSAHSIAAAIRFAPTWSRT